MYADDLYNVIVSQGLDIVQMQDLIQASNENLTEHIEPIGIGQNTKKQEITVACFGVKSREVEREIRKHKLGGKNILQQLKYLGSWISENGSNTRELNARLEAAWQKWFMFSKLLTDSDIPFAVRRLCFINMVYNTLLSGLEAFILSDPELDRLTKFICSRCRALLLGKAHSKINNTHTSLSNSTVLKKTAILPVHLELTVRRLKWFKQIVTRPSSAGSLIATWFGQFDFCNQGRNEFPWNIQLHEDLLRANIVEGWTDISGYVFTDPMCLFREKDAREQIENFDHKHLRAAMLDKLNKVYLSSNPDGDIPSGCFQCDVLDIEGNRCPFSANSHAALCRHKVFSKGYGHNLRSVINTLTITNQCIICKSVFASKVSAQHHLSNALITGSCQTDLGFKATEPVCPSSLVCPLSLFNDGTCCQYEAPDLSTLQSHIVEHLKEYFDLDNHILKLGSLRSDQNCVSPQPELATSTGSSLECCHFVPSRVSSNGFHQQDDNCRQAGSGRVGRPENECSVSKKAKTSRVESKPGHSNAGSDHAIRHNETGFECGTKTTSTCFSIDVDSNGASSSSTTSNRLCKGVRQIEQRKECRLATCANLEDGSSDSGQDCKRENRITDRMRRENTSDTSNCPNRIVSASPDSIWTKKGLLSCSTMHGEDHKIREGEHSEIRAITIGNRSEIDTDGNPLCIGSTGWQGSRGNRSSYRSGEETSSAYSRTQREQRCLSDEAISSSTCTPLSLGATSHIGICKDTSVFEPVIELQSSTAAASSTTNQCTSISTLHDNDRHTCGSRGTSHTCLPSQETVPSCLALGAQQVPGLHNDSSKASCDAAHDISTTSKDSTLVTHKRKMSCDHNKHESHKVNKVEALIAIPEMHTSDVSVFASQIEPSQLYSSSKEETSSKTGKLGLQPSQCHNINLVEHVAEPDPLAKSIISNAQYDSAKHNSYIAVDVSNADLVGSSQSGSASSTETSCIQNNPDTHTVQHVADPVFAKSIVSNAHSESDLHLSCTVDEFSTTDNSASSQPSSAACSKTDPCTSTSAWYDSENAHSHIHRGISQSCSPSRDTATAQSTCNSNEPANSNHFPFTHGDKSSKCEHAEVDSKPFSTDRNPFDVSDCEFEDESDGDYRDYLVGDSQVNDGDNQNDGTQSASSMPCPLDKSRSLFSTLNQSVSLAVQSRRGKSKSSVIKKTGKKSNLAYSKQLRADIRHNDNFADSEVAKRYLSARSNKRASPSHVDQSIRGIPVSKKRRR